jgi:hypothetical protein
MIRSRHFVFSCIFAIAFAALPALARAGAPEPGTVVTPADLGKVMGGSWTTGSSEPGFLSCEEKGGYRVVHVYLYPANGKTVAEMMPGHRDNGETVDEVAGVGDAAMYRPQYGEATVEKKTAAGEILWLSVAVHNVDDAAERKRLAVELARRAAARLP